MNGAHLRTLNRALEIVGSKEQLSMVLHVAAPDLEQYLAGDTALPYEVFIEALEIVAGGRQGQRSR
jgi:DNA-binding transcriptional regulator YdaS (Cro superfamily)